MRKWLLLGIAAALMAWATTGFAYPNLNATTGLIGVPNAHVVEAGQLVGAADLIFLDDTTFNIRAIYGLTERLEGGIALVSGSDDGVALNAKYQLPINPLGFTWATGLTYITADDAGSGFQLYFAGTKPLGTPEGAALYGTLGLTFTDLEELTALRPFAGVQWLLAANTEVGAEFELEAGDFSESILSVYLRQRLGNNLSGQIGITNANGFAGTRDHDLFVGASLAF